MDKTRSTHTRVSRRGKPRLDSHTLKSRRNYVCMDIAIYTKQNKCVKRCVKLQLRLQDMCPVFLDIFSFLTALKREQTLQIVTLKDAGHTWTEIFCLLNDTVPISVMGYRYKRYKSDGIPKKK